MNQERTMQFILDNLAAVTASQQQAEVRAARTDRQIKSMQTLMLTGMRLIARLEKGQRELSRELRELSVRQNRIDQRMNRWMGRPKNGSNGKGAHPEG